MAEEPQASVDLIKFRFVQKKEVGRALDSVRRVCAAYVYHRADAESRPKFDHVVTPKAAATACPDCNPSS